MAAMFVGLENDLKYFSSNKYPFNVVVEVNRQAVFMFGHR